MAVKKNTLLIVASIVTVVAFGLWKQSSQRSAAQLQQRSSQSTGLHSGTLFPKPRPLPEFKLIDTDKRAFTPDSLHGDWSLLFMGFSTCPQICPRILGIVKEAYNYISPNDQPRFVFISLDPKRDDPKTLKDFLSHIDARFLGVTGSHHALQTLAKDLGLFASNADDPEQEDIVHSASVLMVNPKGEVVALLNAPSDARSFAHDVKAARHAQP